MVRLTDWIDRTVELKPGVRRGDDILASIVHSFGFLLAAAAAVHLVSVAAGFDSPPAVAGSLVYGLSMCGVFAASSLYHGLRPSFAKKVLRLLDHSSIYVLIAGTYTPYALATGGESGRILLVSIWFLCIVGLATNVVFWGRFKALHIAVYLVMGWLVVFFWRPFADAAPPGQMRWMLIGGICYTVGVVFYVARGIPRSHVIWHLFVVAGAAGLHVGILRYAVRHIG